MHRIAACVETAAPPAAGLPLKHVHVNFKLEKSPLSKGGGRQRSSGHTPEGKSTACQVISNARHLDCFAESHALRLEAIQQFVNEAATPDQTSTPSLLEPEEGRRNVEQPRISRHVINLKESLSQQCYPYYRRLWYHVTQNHWEAINGIICKLQAQHLVNEVLLTFKLWSDALNIQKAPQEVLERLSELQDLPRADPLICRINQNLLDSYFELRELRVLTVANLIPNFCHIAWTSAAAVKERRLSRLRQRLRSMSPDEALRCTIEDLRSMAQHDLLQNPPVLETVSRHDTLAKRVPLMRQRRRLAVEQLTASAKHHASHPYILEGPSTRRTVDDLLGAALLLYAQDTGRATSHIGTLQWQGGIQVKKPFSPVTATADAHSNELASVGSQS